ncbi:MAG: hypothetical protein HY770_07745 [Chitinivibrionia bacterium]|nr:hypothetical protein [Chitinivibrionia bacterium]
MDAAGSSSQYLTAGNYTARLTFMIQDGYLEVDYLKLYSTVPVESRTWGAIKAIYDE